MTRRLNLSVSNVDEKPTVSATGGTFSAGAYLIDEISTGTIFSLLGADPENENNYEFYFSRDPNTTSEDNLHDPNDATAWGNTDGRFAINRTTGAISFLSSGLNNYEDTYWAGRGHETTVTVIAREKTGGAFPTQFNSAPITLTIRQQDVNEAPTDVFFASGGSVSETAPNGTVVGQLDASDPDAGDTHSFSLSNNAGGRFSLTVGGQLRVNNSSLIDADGGGASSHLITVRARDGDELPFDKDLIVSVNPVNEAPIITNATLPRYVSEDAFPGADFVGTISATGGGDGRVAVTDPEGDAFTYSIIGGTGASVFSVNSTGAIQVQQSLDYETQTSYTLTVRATEVGNTSNFDTETITINVIDQDDLIATGSVYDPTEASGAPIGEFVLSGEAIADGYTQDAIVDTDQNGFESDWESTLRNPSGLSVAFIQHSFVAGVFAGGDVYLSRPGYFILGNQNDSINSPFEVWLASGATPPLVFDLDRDGIELTEIGDVDIFFDQDSDGLVQRTGWVGADDAFLVLDRNGDGAIAAGSEISFVQDLPGATTDLEGLAAFDTNADGKFDLWDERFAEFQIWQDLNQDGVSQASELNSLLGAGIAGIDLTPTPTGQTTENTTGNVVFNTAEFIRTDGTRGEVGDVALRYSSLEQVEPFVALDATGTAGDDLADAVDDAIEEAARVLEEAVLDPVQELRERFRGKRYDLAPRVEKIEAEVEALEAELAEIGDAMTVRVNRLVEEMARFDRYRGGGEIIHHRMLEAEYPTLASSL